MRNTLLQESLREPNMPFAIETEYPIVLAEKNHQFSHCIFENDKIVSHANLWPRTWIDSTTNTSFKIGLIGNVATDKNCRGQGHFKNLQLHMEKMAQTLHLDALVLWSELTSFYQKLGYNAHSEEKRFYLSHQLLDKYFQTRKFLPNTTKVASEPQLELFLKKRNNCQRTLDRSAKEFKELLRTPATHLFNNQDSYGITGKGCDMIGVIHEWGVSQAEELGQMAFDINNALGSDEIILLAPQSIPPKWIETLERYSSKVENHPMALVKPLDGENSKPILKSMSQGFIWGLDSI